MNSKELVRKAIDKKETDKIPLGLYVTDHDIISQVIGRPTLVRNKPGIQLALWDGRRDEIVESMKQDIVDFYKKTDCVNLLTFKEAQFMPPKGYIPEKKPEKIDDKTYRDKNGIWRLEPDANDIMFQPDKAAADFQEHSIYEYTDRTPPAAPDPSCFELMDTLVEHFGKERYIAGVSGGITAVSYIGGIEEGLMTMALQPEVVKAHNEQSIFRQDIMDKYYIRPGTDGILVEQDMAGTNGPLVSPEMFRELCFPYYSHRIQQLKKYRTQVILHNCGNNLPIMNMLVEGGIDAYESIQTNSAMNIRKLTELYSEKLCIWGAVPLEVLVSGTQDDTRREVRKCMEEGKKAKGFILGPSHSIAFGTKYDNFMAMLDEYVKLRDS